MLAGKHIDRVSFLLICLFVIQASAYLRFSYKIDDNSIETPKQITPKQITSKQITPEPSDTNRFTSALMSLFGLNGMPSNTRGPTHDTPPLPCRCRKCFN